MCQGGDIMLKLKTTFDQYIKNIEECIQKSITDKFIEQVACCVLTDIAEQTKQDDIAEDEDNE